MAAQWYEGKRGKAEHLVYLDKKGKELEKLILGTKTAIIRGAAGKKVPLGGRVKINDILYFVETGSDLLVTHRAVVSDVTETPKMTEEISIDFVQKHQDKLNLEKHQVQRWAGKKYLCIVELVDIKPITPFKYRRDSNMDDWIITDDIKKIMEDQQ